MNQPLHASTVELISQSYVVMKLDTSAEKALASAIEAAQRFFAHDLDVKARYSSADENFGFRRMGKEYSISPDRPDVNDCFTLWSDRLDLIPSVSQIGWLTDPILEVREQLATLVATMLDDIASSLGAPSSAIPTFRRASHLQVNDYRVEDGRREYAQERHEDGHLLTVWHSQLPGLEILKGERVTPVVAAPNEVLVFAGSALTAVTAGRIAPLYHQVRNQKPYRRRQSLMYFVNPDLDKPVRSWSTHDDDMDLRAAIRQHPSGFGLPPVPAL